MSDETHIVQSVHRKNRELGMQARLHDYSDANVLFLMIVSVSSLQIVAALIISLLR